jgi:hypothetical protein
MTLLQRVGRKSAYVYSRARFRRALTGDPTADLVRLGGRWWLGSAMARASREDLHWRHVADVHQALSAGQIDHAVLPDPGTSRADVAVDACDHSAALRCLRATLRDQAYYVRDLESGSVRLLGLRGGVVGNPVAVYRRWHVPGSPGLTDSELACRILPLQRRTDGWLELPRARRFYNGPLAPEELTPLEFEYRGARWPGNVLAHRALEDRRDLELFLVEPRALRVEMPRVADLLAEAAFQSWRHYAPSGVRIHRPVAADAGSAEDRDRVRQALAASRAPHVIVHPTTAVLTGDVDTHRYFPTSALAATMLSRRPVGLLSDDSSEVARLAKREASDSCATFNRYPYPGPHAFMGETAREIAKVLEPAQDRSTEQDLGLQEACHLPVWRAFQAGAAVTRRPVLSRLSRGTGGVRELAVAARAPSRGGIVFSMVGPGGRRLRRRPEHLLEVIGAILPEVAAGETYDEN